ncbi:hypothetical protein D6783_04625, partial [Candidatus Woesearchaeota archaeon]
MGRWLEPRITQAKHDRSLARHSCFTSTLFALVLLIGVAIASAPHASAQTPEISVNPNTLSRPFYPGDTILVDVLIAGAAGNVYGYQYDLHFVESRTDLVSTTEGDYLSNNGQDDTFFRSGDDRGDVLEGVASTRTVPGAATGSSGTLATHTFQAPHKTSAVGDSNMFLANVALSDIDQGSIPFTLKDATVTIASSARNLSTHDDTDTNPSLKPGDDVTFYAVYTFVGNEEYVEGTCDISFDNFVTSSPMTFNPTQEYYYYTRTFTRQEQQGNYWVRCDDLPTVQSDYALSCLQVSSTEASMCNNGLDDDCDSAFDCDDADCSADPACAPPVTCTDNDGDRYIQENVANVASCGNVCGPTGTQSCLGANDCDDNNDQKNPGASEQCDGIDNDCNGQIDDGVTGGPSCTQEGVCAGTVSSCQGGGWVCDYAANDPAYEQSEATCDAKDNDCDGTADEGFDADNDTYYPSTCTGYSVHDCNDNDPAVNPGQAEVCGDSKDNDCDGQVDEGCATCVDNDGDGYGEGCSPGPDCDDTNASIHPGASEQCDGIDNDCQGGVDDGLDSRPCPNQDGVCSGSQQVCQGAAGWSTCDYANYSQDYEPNEASCDAKDNDCDAQVDEDLSQLCPNQQGVCQGASTSCTAGAFPSCTFQTYEAHNSAYEFLIEATCNDGLDNDCDGLADCADPNCNGTVSCPVCEDNDGDGYHAIGGNCPTGNDCNDNNKDVYPGALELCGDGEDNDCNTFTDCDDAACSADSACLNCEDKDGDGYNGYDATLCPGGGDCNDDPGLNGSSINPSAVELCDAVDNNCNGIIDGYDELLPVAPDCTNQEGICAGTKQACENGTFVECTSNHFSDILGSNYTAGNESPNFCQDSQDNNCNGEVDEGCPCEENATRLCGSDVGACEQGIETCHNGTWGECTGQTTPTTETCNNVDDDCDGATDEGDVCKEDE